MNEKFQLIVAGVGGQGSVLISHIIASAAIMDGFNVRVGEKFGAAMRGGAVSSHIRIFRGEIAPVIPIGEADAVMALEPLEGLRATSRYLKKDGILVTNSKPLYPVDVNVGRAKYPDLEESFQKLRDSGVKVYVLDGVSLAIKAGTSKALNSVMLGALTSTGILPISKESLIKALVEMVPKGTEEVNKRAFELGCKSLVV